MRELHLSCGRQVPILLLLWLFWSCHCQWLHIDVLLVAWRGKLATILMVSALWFDDLSMPPSHWFWITTDQLFVWHWNLIQPRRWTLPIRSLHGRAKTYTQSSVKFWFREGINFFVRKKSLISWIKALNFIPRIKSIHSLRFWGTRRKRIALCCYPHVKWPVRTSRPFSFHIPVF